jgi:hypothetical protein
LGRSITLKGRNHGTWSGWSIRKCSGAQSLDLSIGVAYSVLCNLVPEVAARNPDAAGGFRLRPVGRLQDSRYRTESSTQTTGCLCCKRVIVAIASSSPGASRPQSASSAHRSVGKLLPELADEPSRLLLERSPMVRWGSWR